MNLLPSVIAAIVLCLAPKALPAENAPAEKGLSNPFFALCVSTHDARYRTPADQAKLLKELGYDGMAHVWLDGVDEAIKAADDNGLKLFQVYVRASLDPQKPAYDPRLKQVIESLKGHQTSLGLMVQGQPPSTAEHDARAVEIVREIADMAAASGISVALYPHVGDWLERVEDAVRVAEKADRENVGVTFNLCHWLAVDEEEDPRPVLRLAAPYLLAVTINGSERNITRSQRQGWIQTLDRGSFDNGKFLAVLKEVGYTGPVGLQCYGIQGDVRDNLTRSMAAWQQFSARLAAEEK
ncbi:MAG TPA: sugar phosphate isomerase/epimerase family protein [Thermoguttaceae bacterium]|nr:sugar phosphate isomerase/epimerase family protein [Thermoguttaceae bacterium]